MSIGVNTNEIKQGDTNYFSIVDPKISDPSHTSSNAKKVFSSNQEIKNQTE